MALIFFCFWVGFHKNENICQFQRFYAADSAYRDSESWHQALPSQIYHRSGSASNIYHTAYQYVMRQRLCMPPETLCRFSNLWFVASKSFGFDLVLSKLLFFRGLSKMLHSKRRLWGGPRLLTKSGIAVFATFDYNCVVNIVVSPL